MSNNRAVFIDRDGTINKDVPYCNRPEDFHLLPGVVEGIKLLNEMGFKIVVITNQSGIARGYFDEKMLSLIHNKMHTDLARDGAWVDAIYYCPHHPDSHCNCRKPKTTLLYRAARELNIDISGSFVIGDKNMDIQMGKAAGCRTALVPDGKDNDKERRPAEPDFIAPTLLDAACWISEQLKLEQAKTILKSAGGIG